MSERKVTDKIDTIIALIVLVVISQFCMCWELVVR